MKYRRDQLRIEMHCGPTSWAWYLIDNEGEPLDSGFDGIYQHAADAALLAFDEHLDGFMPGV